MHTAGFSSRRWLRSNRDSWFEWLGSPDSTRLARFDRLAQSLVNLLGHRISAAGTGGIVAALPSTLHKCNELAFSAEDEALAYSVWHLVERYARVLQVLDALLRSGGLPLRKTRLTALEVGAGPMPALHAVRDFYADLELWSKTISTPPTLVETTQLYSLDRGAAWGSFNHFLSEQLLREGDLVGPHKFATDFLEFQSFSVRDAHRAAVDSAARRVYDDAIDWGEDLTLGQARNEVGSFHGGPPTALDLIVVCNFLTETSMTSQFEAELAELATSLTPGGVLIMIGSATNSYDEIFDSLDAIMSKTRAVKRITPRRRVSRVNRELRDRVAHALIAALKEIEAGDSDAFGEVHPHLPKDVQPLVPSAVKLQRFRVAAYKDERSRPGRPRTYGAAGPVPS